MLRIVFPLLFLTVSMAADFPSQTLKTDDLTVTVYTPDAANGRYRGTRFDWSGVFDVQFGQHKLFGPWLSKPDPKNHDSIVGPCEEFGMFVNPLNYDDAKVGEPFLKIGVGILEKPKEEKYRFFHNYKIVEAGTWKVQTTGKMMTFEQTVKTDFGYSYVYTKSLSVKGREIVIGHTLENTDKKIIHTDHYNHNFFNVDDDAVGKNYELEFPFVPTADKPKERFAEIVKLDGKKLTFTSELDTGTIYSGVTGFDATTATAGVTMTHKPSGVSVRVTGDRPLKQFNVWGMTTTICPEPFIELKIDPGKSVRWEWKYEFSK